MNIILLIVDVLSIIASIISVVAAVKAVQIRNNIEETHTKINTVINSRTGISGISLEGNTFLGNKGGGVNIG